MDELTPVYRDEVLQIRCEETKTRGPHIIFTLPEPASMDPFRGYDGHTYIAQIFRLDDKSQVVEPVERVYKRFKGAIDKALDKELVATGENGGTAVITLSNNARNDRVGDMTITKRDVQPKYHYKSGYRYDETESGELKETEIKPASIDDASEYTATGYTEGMGSKPVDVKISLDDATAKEWDEAAKKGRVGKNCWHAIQICKDDNFIKYAAHQQQLKPKNFRYNAEVFMKKKCKVSSRNEFDTDADAEIRFVELQKMYSVWAAQQGIC